MSQEELFDFIDSILCGQTTQHTSTNYIKPMETNESDTIIYSTIEYVGPVTHEVRI